MMFRQAQHANKKSTLNLPKGWEMKSLGDVCDLQNGYAFKSKTYIPSSNTLNIRMSNIRPDGSFNPEHNIKYLPDNFSDEYSQFLLEQGDLVIAMTDMAGDPKILGLPTIVKKLKGRSFLLNQRVGKLKDFTDDIYVPYLCYFLGSPKIKEYYKRKGAGGLQINISKKDILTAEIPIPPLPEQKQIVDLLDNAFEVIERSRNNLEKNIANAKELFQSKLNDIFSRPALSEAEGWEEKTLGEVCEFYNGKAHEKDIDENGEYVVVNSKFISSDGNVKKYTKKQMFPLFENDIAMVMSDVPNGKALAKCYIIDEIEKYSLNQRICAIRSDEYFVKFLYYNLNRNKFLLSFNNGENQTNLRKGDILKCPLFLPPKEKQKEIARHIDKLVENIRLVESHYHQKLANLEDLKKSLLQKAFSGALTSTSSVTARQAQSPLDKLSHR